MPEGCLLPSTINSAPLDDQITRLWPPSAMACRTLTEGPLPEDAVAQGRRRRNAAGAATACQGLVGQRMLAVCPAVVVILTRSLLWPIIEATTLAQQGGVVER